MTDREYAPDKPRVPCGAAIHWTPEEITRLSEITPADIEAAKQRWREHTDPEFSELLDARAETDKPERD